jgi:hypothetical protein
MSDDEKQTKEEENDSSIYYVLGGVVLVAAVAGFFLLRPKTETPANPTAAVSAPVVVPTPGPITKLACEKIYYNPVIGFAKYYISVEGADTVTAGDVKCSYSMTVKDIVVRTDEETAPLTEVTSRGGGTFRCTSKALELAKGVPTKVNISLENPNKTTATCSQTFIFP